MRAIGKPSSPSYSAFRCWRAASQRIDKILSQPLHGVVQTRLHRADGHLQNGGDLAVLEALVELEDERDSQLIRQAVEGSPDPVAKLRADGDRLRIGGFSGRQ